MAQVDGEPPKWSPLAPTSTAQSVGWSKKKTRTKKKPIKGQLVTKGKNEAPPPAPLKKESKKRKLPPVHKAPPAPAPPVVDAPGIDAPAIQTVQPTNAHPYHHVTGTTIVWTGTDASLTWRDSCPKMCLIGRATIRLVQGKVDLMGCTLNEDNKSTLLEVESPSWTSALTMTCFQEGTRLAIASLRGQGQERTFRLVSPADARPTVLPLTWTHAVDAILNDWSIRDGRPRDAKLLICGAKGVGKSTCLRYAVNRLLAVTDSVMVLDCDAGQPECSPPGMLTLTKLDQPILSPPHLHMADDHVGAYFFGHTTSKADPTMYLEMLTLLLQKYTDIVNQEHGGDGTKLPLLINTDGWVKGLGMEILATLLHTLTPNHVIQILGDYRSKQFDLPLSPTTKLHLARAYNVDSPVDLGTVLSIPSPAYRSLRLCTYFLQTTSMWDHCDFGQFGIIDDDNEIAHGLASAKPVVVSMDAVQVLWRGECAATLDQHLLWNALNGSVVGLCDDRTGGTCRGLGIVRSIDHRKRLAFVLTPVPMKDLVTVDTLIGGGIPLGRECYFRGVHSEAFPFVTCDGVTAGIGGDVMKSRNNLIRKGGN